jgi:hypothetical protein
VVTATTAVSSVRLDGVAVAAPFSPIGTSGYSGASLLVPAGTSTLTADAPFTAIVYQGLLDSSYAYPAAAGMAVP